MENINTVEESAKLLRVGLPTLRTWIFKERIPVIRIGRKVFIKDKIIKKILDKGLEAVQHDK